VPARQNERMKAARATAEAVAVPAPLWPLVLAIAVRLLAWLSVSHTRFASDEDSYFAVATALLGNGEQNLFWPPVTGWVIAAIRWVFRTDAIAHVRIIWILFDIACLLLIRELATRLGRAMFDNDPVKVSRVSLLATAGYAIYLPAVSHAQFATSETPALLQTLIVLVLLSKADAGLATYVGAGLVAGTLALTRPSLLPLLMLWPLAAWRSAVSSESWCRAMVFVLTGVVVVGAWAVRNWYVAGQLTIANNSAYNLFIGNRNLYAEDLDLFHPVATREQIEFRRQQWSGQLVYPAEPPAELQRQALAWIAAHPVGFARRAVGRLARVFAPKTDVLELAGGEQQAGAFSPISLVLMSAANAQWTVILFGGLIGLASIVRLAPGLGRIFVATIVGSVLLCTVAIAKPRYSFVFDPVLLLGLAALLTAPFETTAAVDARSRRILIVLAIFLLWGWTAWLIFAVSSRMAL
jgi:hypothetical protein